MTDIIPDEIPGADQFQEDERTQTIVEQPKKPTGLTPKEIGIGDDGQVNPTNVMELFYVADMIFKSGLVPGTYNKVQQVVIAIQTAKERGISPLRLIQNSYILDQKLQVYGSFPKTEVMRSGKCAEYREWLVDEQYEEICLANKNLKNKAYAGVCKTKRSDNGHEEETFFTLDMAKIAGLSTNPKRKGWVSYPHRMLLARARSLNLEYNFGDVIGGLVNHEDDFDNKPETVDADNLNDLIDKEPPIETIDAFKAEERVNGIGSAGTNTNGGQAIGSASAPENNA